MNMNDELPFNNKFSIGIIGPVSAGKSTFTNAIFVNKFSQTKKKRTTMLPQIYIENNKSILTNKELNEILTNNNESNKFILNSEDKLTDTNCIPIYHNIPKSYDLFNFPKSISLNFLDMPGLNDSNTEDIYYNYINNVYTTLDIIFIVIDINESFNTSGTIKILQNMVTNATQNPNKLMNFFIIANKCDELTVNKDGDLIFLDEEYQELYEQIEYEVSTHFKDINNIKYEILKLSAEDSYIYRMYKKNPKVKLDEKLINKFGINEFGKRKWASMSDKKKIEKMNDFLEDINMTECLKATGFTKLKDTMNTIFNYQKQYEIMINNIYIELESIDKYSILYEDNITIKYLHIIISFKKLIDIYSKYKIILDIEKHSEFIQNNFNENINQILFKEKHSEFINNNFNGDINELSKEKYINILNNINILIVKLHPYICIDLVDEHLKYYIEEDIQLCIKLIDIEFDTELWKIQIDEDDAFYSLNFDTVIQLYHKLKNNKYNNLEEIILKGLQTLISKIPSCIGGAFSYNYGVTRINYEDPFIYLFSNLIKHFDCPLKEVIECIKKIINYRVYQLNFYYGLFTYTFNNLVMSNFNDDFKNYLLNLKILLDNRYLFNPSLKNCGNYGGKRIWSKPEDNEYREYNQNETTLKQKENMMSLFNYMINLQLELQNNIAISVAATYKDDDEIDDESDSEINDESDNEINDNSDNEINKEPVDEINKESNNEIDDIYQYKSFKLY